MKIPLRVEKQTSYEIAILGNGSSTQSLNFGWVYVVGFVGDVTLKLANYRVGSDRTETELEPILTRDLFSPGTVAVMVRGDGEEVTKLIITTGASGFQGELHAELDFQKP
jgi:hypothetical protein